MKRTVNPTQFGCGTLQLWHYGDGKLYVYPMNQRFKDCSTGTLELKQGRGAIAHSVAYGAVRRRQAEAGGQAMKGRETPKNDLYQQINEWVKMIEEANRCLRAMNCRPVNVCMTPTDVPPFTWKAKRGRG